MTRPELEHRGVRTLRWALLASLAAHLLALPYLAPALIFRPPAEPGPLKVLAPSQQSPALLAERERVRRKMRELERERERRAEEQRLAEQQRRDEEQQKLTGQIVDLPPSADDRAPENARFLSEHNTRVERETRSRFQAKVAENVMNEVTTARKGQLSAPSADQRPARALEIGPAQPGQPATDAGQGGPALEIPDSRRRDRLALKLDPELGRLQNREAADEVKGNSDRLKLSLGPGDQAEQRGSAPAEGPSVAELIPGIGVLARLSGAPSNDHLEDVEEGDGTFLNSREFKFASYFNRMKRGVSQHWDPLTEYRRRDPTGNIYGFRSRVTVLQVTLKPDGSLKNVEVQRSSGLDFLDREAVAAFQRAQPFPNPPRALVTDGQIAFPFGFHLDFNSRSGLRLPF